MSAIFRSHFASPERLTVTELANLPVRIAGMEHFQWLERIPMMIYLTNPFRQIVYCNPPFKRAVRPELQETIIGLRPGEALGCVHAEEMEAGCGCSTSCKHCGAAQAILKSLQGEELCKECHIEIRDGELSRMLNVQVLARPFLIDEQIFSLNTAFDISHERMLFAQNRSFLHNMINAAGGMEALLAFMKADREKHCMSLEELHQCTLNMLHEVLYQYDSIAVEAGKLAVNVRDCDLVELIENLAEQMRHHAVGRGRKIVTSGSACSLQTDPRLVRHVLANLIVNALEGSQAHDVVEIHWEKRRDGIFVHVENPGSIPSEISALLFQQIVSSKGVERGLGLYMANNIAKKYLKTPLSFEQLPGKVRFTLKMP